MGSVADWPCQFLSGVCYPHAMKTLRLFALLDQLRLARHPVSAEILAQRLGVSLRTIYRDMATLTQLGAPVRGESGLGYQLEKGYFLPPLRFDPDEAEAIMLGLRLVRARGTGGLHDAAARVAGKVADAMGQQRGEQFHDLPLLAVSRERPGEDQAAQWGDALRKMIRERVVVELTYSDLAENESCRRVWPLGLTLFDDAWLLIAWCEVRSDFRHFRLDRIRHLSATGERFAHQKGRRFQDYLDRL